MCRPRINIDKEQFEKLCGIHCTLLELSDWFSCSEDTIERWCRREYQMSFADVFKKKSGKGKISLRRLQWQSAENGNITMQIWLGKQWLGQAEKVETDSRTIITGDPEPVFYLPEKDPEPK